MEELIYYGKGQRIDAWLTTQFSYSRNFFQHIISSRRLHVITSTGREIFPKKSYTLQDGDRIHIENLERFTDGGILSECPVLDMRRDNIEYTSSSEEVFLGIVVEKDDYMVIYKPKGILAHPNSVRDVAHPSVVGGIYHYLRTQDGDNSIPSTGAFLRAGLIHRLDKETDGLMLIAKTEEGLAYFKQLFQQKSLASTIQEKEMVPLKKYYQARSLVTERGEQFLDEIRSQLPYTIIEDVVAKVPHTIPKQGITKILGITRTEHEVLLDIEILTGRTHQIRYHVSQHGLPIIGDYVYGEEDAERRMCLTAKRLLFTDIYGEQIDLIC